MALSPSDNHNSQLVLPRAPRNFVSRGRKEVKPFLYSRAKPEERWPHRSGELNQQRIARELESVNRVPLGLVPVWEEPGSSDVRVEIPGEGHGYVDSKSQTALARRLHREEGAREREARREQQKGQSKRIQSMPKLALRKVADLKSKAWRLSIAIRKLELSRPVADVLDGWPEQLNNDEMLIVVKRVGDQDWKRAVEIYEWLNSRKLYTPNPLLLATVLRILGRTNQLEIAQDLFSKTEQELTSSIRVFNAILGAYANQGKWQAAQPILECMVQRGCEPDIATFNLIAYARCKDGLPPGMASALLKEIERAGLRPNATTYNTLVHGCITNNIITEAKEIVKEMEQRGFELTRSSDVLGKD
ncbi:pentatricopeptide repeat-containing protein At3g18110, chloroplastic isoform X2 [Physcomitrium patens]|uniref:pentatricopeptide repeat-containing protein At3g18110, chloroplastic isoform X2 n=1 Tax=Physcomitrium patens TaxID=3218 RepID=UPI003CCD7804